MIPDVVFINRKENQLFRGLRALELSQQSGYSISPSFQCSIIHELMLLELVALIPDIAMGTFPNGFLNNNQLPNLRGDGFDIVFIGHSLKLLEKFWCLDGILSSVVGECYWQLKHDSASL